MKNLILCIALLTTGILQAEADKPFFSYFYFQSRVLSDQSLLGKPDYVFKSIHDGAESTMYQWSLESEIYQALYKNGEMVFAVMFIPERDPEIFIPLIEKKIAAFYKTPDVIWKNVKDENGNSVMGFMIGDHVVGMFKGYLLTVARVPELLE